MSQPFEPDRSFDGNAGELDLHALWRAVVRKKHRIIWPTVVAFVGVGLYVMLTKPMYMAEAQVLLENQESFLPRPARADTPSETTLALDAESVGSQVQLVTSRDIARRVIAKLGLVGNPEFDPAAKDMGAISRVLMLFGLMRDPTREAPEDRVVDTFERRLTVFSPTQTRVLTIQFKSHDPKMAARITNEIVALYLDTQSDAKRQRAKTAGASLATQIAELRSKLTVAADAVEIYRTNSGLLAGSNNMTISGQQLVDLNGELSRARTEEADAQAKASLIREMMRAGRISDIADVANNEFVRRIAEQTVTARAQLALESQTLLPGHPRIKELVAEIAGLDTQLQAAVAKTARTLENNARISAARVANLQAAIDQQKISVGHANVDEVHLHELERIAQALRDQLDASMARYQEALARETSPATPADARIITRAVAPDEPSFPKKIPILIFGTLAAFVLSTAAVISGELLAGSGDLPPDPPIGRPRTIGDSWRQTPPRAPPPNRWRDFGRSSTDMRQGPANIDGFEPGIDPIAMRAGRANLATGTAQAQGVRIVATAITESYVAATALLAYARSLARDGRPIILDLDAKGSEFAALLNSDDAPSSKIAGKYVGLTDLLTGRAGFAEVIHRDAGSRLHFIGFGSGAEFDPAALDLVLEALAQTYDFIILTAPALAASEMAKSLAPHADFVVLVGAWEAQERCEAAYGELIAAGAAEVMLIGKAGRPESQARYVA
jgi:uncharacterized protein involved in exopolysaccharide biosynthesis